MHRPEKIIVTGDRLRPTKDLLHHDQTGNILWFYHLLRYPLAVATGLPVEAATNGSLESFRQQYEVCGLEPSLESWAQLYSAAPSALKALWIEEYAGSLVVGFEMPPSLRRTLDEAGIPYVDAMLHPVRFLDDIFFCFRSNLPEVQAALDGLMLDEAKVWLSAGYMRAFAARRARPKVPEGVSLFAAQMSVDRSMIDAGRFMKQSEVIDGIRPLIEGRAVLYKDHPYEMASLVRKSVEQKATTFSSTDANIYLLLASDAVRDVISVSSSVGHEAKFFNKPSVFSKGLSTPVRYRGQADDGSYASIYDLFLSVDFWRKVLGAEIPVTKPDGETVPYRPNFLRASLGSYWGYGMVANDPIIENANPIDDLRRFPQTKKILVQSEKFLTSRAAKILYGTVKRLRAR
jgi:hypothetical protein